MRIVYRMRGLLGDATEEFIESLDSTTGIAFHRHRSTSGLRFGTSGSSCSESSGVFETDTLGILFRSGGIVSSLRKNTVIYSLVQVPLVLRVGGNLGRK